MKRLLSILLITISINTYSQSSQIDDRVNRLLNQLTTEEKISLLGYKSKSVDRLNIPAYNWWNEGLHGVARAGKATVFPQAIGMAASFNAPLLNEAATIISTEARAKYNLAREKRSSEQYMGLTFWSPNINIFRDPRWGRGQETYGEDPFLTATMGLAFVSGLQGSDPLHLKTAACAKHFAVHSGPEFGRHTFNAIVDEKDLRETYLYAFKKLVDGGVESVMCAYNRVNDEPCCTGNTLLQTILHKEWKFKGHVVTDCGALDDVWERHKALPTAAATAAAAIKAGVNLDCSSLLQKDVGDALAQNLLTVADVDQALTKLLYTEVKLGFFDDKKSDPYRNYREDSISNSYHQNISRKLAQESMVLIKNSNILPLQRKNLKSIMIVGPNSSSLDALLGNYHGVSGNAITFIEGITRSVDAGIRIEYDQGCDNVDTTKFGGIWAAGNAEATVAVIGLTPVYEGEEGDAFMAHGGDKLSMDLPAAHIAYIKALRKGIKNKPLIAVITGGSAMDLSSIAPFCDAIIYAGYPGEQGGQALADILFGDASPSGRLPITFYQSMKSLPEYSSYAMQGRTYRYYSGSVQYPFGFGLSYTSFQYRWLKQPAMMKDSITIDINIKNTGNFNSNEVVQVYIQYPDIERMPLKELKAFKKVSINQGSSNNVHLSIDKNELKKWDLSNHQWKLYPGTYKIIVGKNAKEDWLVSQINL